MTDLRVAEPKSAVSCGFLPKSSVSCENLQFFCGFLCHPKLVQMLEFPGERVNLRKSAVFCGNLRFGLSL